MDEIPGKEVYAASNLRDGRIRLYQIHRLDDDEQHYRHTITEFEVIGEEEAGKMIARLEIDLPHRLEQDRRDRIVKDLYPGDNRASRRARNKLK